MTITKKLVGELLGLLKNDNSEEKLLNVIKRLEDLENESKKTIIDKKVKNNVEKYETINHHIHLGNRRFKLEPVSIMVEPYKYKTILLYFFTLVKT